MHKTARRPITAESYRPERVDENGRPEIVSGDGPPAGGDVTAPEPAPAPAPPPAPAPEPAPAPPSTTAAAPEPAPAAAGITTAEILAALGVNRATVAHVTREPSPYVEAGGRVSDRVGFFTDRYAWRTRGDGAAGRRVAQFQAQLRDYVAAAMDTAGGPQVIPPAWGGSWFVDKIARQRPLVSSFSSASITNPSPIPVPVFRDTTPSSLVGDHVEGVPDTPGTVNFDQVTVTPKAKSGRAEVTRELLDSSPALVDRIVSEALRESYAQITESTMAGVLAAGATVGPAGGATAAAAEQAIRTALGLLPGTRFAPGRVVLPSAHVWGALVAADTADGRPLIPYIGYGPTRRGRRGGPGLRLGGGIAGLETLPAWALDTGQVIVGAGPADAMSFESSLLEFRFEEKNGPEISSEFNVWGLLRGRRAAPEKGRDPHYVDHRSPTTARWSGTATQRQRRRAKPWPRVGAATAPPSKCLRGRSRSRRCAPDSGAHRPRSTRLYRVHTTWRMLISSPSSIPSVPIRSRGRPTCTTAFLSLRCSRIATRRARRRRRPPRAALRWSRRSRGIAGPARGSGSTSTPGCGQGEFQRDGGRASYGAGR